MDIVEWAVIGKRGLDTCEDAAVCTPHHAAVIDGATDLSGATFSGRTGGQIAAGAVAAAVACWPADIGWSDAVASASEAVAEAVAAAGQPDRAPCYRPRAALAVYSSHRRQVWRVGDIRVRVGGTTFPTAPGLNGLIDDFRRAWLTSLLAEGTAPDLSAGDPGLAAAYPLLARQEAFANTVGYPWSYGVIDGTDVPAAHVDIIDVPAGAEVVLATDGHIDISADLAHAETALADALAADPLALDDRRRSRAARTGDASFDDRTWIRLRT